MQKKQMIIVGAVVGLIVLILAGVGVYAFMKSRSKPEETPQTAQKKKKISTFNVIPVAERPYILIRPSEGGRNIFLVIEELKKPADAVEYELEYQAGELLQGAFGELPLTSFPASKDILLGSCSAGGACTYHQNVQGGTLVTRFSGTDEYALKNDWRYIDNTARETTAASKDAKFQIDSPEIAKQRVVIITNSPGYPGTLPGTSISDIYSLSTVSTLTGTVEVTMRANEDATAAKVAVWDGSTWKTVAGTADDKSLTAEVPFGQAYVVIKE